MRIRGQCGLHVSGKVYFGNDGDVSFGGIGNDILRFFLGVEAFVGLAVILAGVSSDDGFLAFGTYLREPRIFLDFQSPTLIFGEMPMQAVHVVESHHVDKGLHFVHRKEMAGYVNVRSSVAEARVIVDFYGRQYRDTVLFHRDGLTQRLDAIKHAGLACSGDGHAIRRYLQLISFRIFGGQPRHEQYVAFSFRTGFNGVIRSGSFFQIIGKVTGIAAHCFVVFGIDDFYTAVKFKTSVGTLGNLLWQRDNAVIGYRLLRITTRSQYSGHSQYSCQFK